MKDNISIIDTMYNKDKKMQRYVNKYKVKMISTPKYQEDINLFCKRNNINTYDEYIDNLAKRIKIWGYKVNMYYICLNIEKTMLKKDSQLEKANYIKSFEELQEKNVDDIVSILNNKNEILKLLDNCDCFVSNFEKEAIEQLQRFYKINNEYYDYESLQDKFERMTKDDIEKSKWFSTTIRGNIDLIF